MMAVRVQCPFCAKALKFRQAPVPGRRLLCNGCNRTFPVPANVAAPEPAPAPQPVPAGAVAPAPDWALAAPKITLPEPTPPPAVLPSSILIPVAPPPPSPALTPAPAPSSADDEAPDEDVPGPRRGLLIGGVAGALVLLVGSTVLAVALASRADRRRHHEPVALVNPPSSKNEDLLNQQSFSQPRSVQPQQVEDDFSPPPRRNDDNPPLARPRNGDRPPPRVNTPEPPSEVADVRTGLPRDLQEQVNKAIDKGVEHLKSKQLANGTWENAHSVGLAALPGLTLLECGVKADDPCVQKAAKLVRENVLKLTSHSTTYESSLALLFLDRLGDPKDKELIRSIAMRLVAGQLPGGGWTYNLPVLTAQENRQLLEFLSRTRPERDLERMVGNKTDDRKLDSTVKKSGSLDAYYEAQEAKKNEKGSTKGFDREKPRKDAVKPLSLAEAKKAAEKLPQKLRTVTAVTDAAAKPKPNNKLLGGGDNSNTQFAMLALWAARRHDLPLERSLDAVGKRFRDSQKTDGTWLYMTPPQGWGTPAMTGSGLLGLAVGHGSATDPDRRFKVKDEKINLGLKALGQQVGKPLGADPEMKKKNKKGKVIALKKPQSPINLYFLWTVERVGVLYDVREMDGKDWYLWGVEQLLPTQDNDGSWHQGNYPGSTRGVDTCFALLFLKRANLASDLTRRLDFVVEGKPGK